LQGKVYEDRRKRITKQNFVNLTRISVKPARNPFYLLLKEPPHFPEIKQIVIPDRISLSPLSCEFFPEGRIAVLSLSSTKHSTKHLTPTTLIKWIKLIKPWLVKSNESAIGGLD
jgi:hypothetical protein